MLLSGGNLIIGTSVQMIDRHYDPARGTSHVVRVFRTGAVSAGREKPISIGRPAQ